MRIPRGLAAAALVLGLAAAGACLVRDGIARSREREFEWWMGVAS